MIAVTGAAMFAASAQAQDWAGMGPLLADYYNEAMSRPKGWELTYTGLQQGVEVFTFIIRPDTVDVDTSWLDADEQMKRLMCGDEMPRSWMQAGMKVRVDKTVISGGKRETEKGTSLLTCD